MSKSDTALVVSAPFIGPFWLACIIIAVIAFG